VSVSNFLSEQNSSLVGASCGPQGTFQVLFQYDGEGQDPQHPVRVYFYSTSVARCLDIEAARSSQATSCSASTSWNKSSMQENNRHGNLLLPECGRWEGYQMWGNGQPASRVGSQNCWSRTRSVHQEGVSSHALPGPPCRKGSDHCWQNDGKHFPLWPHHVRMLADHMQAGKPLNGHDDVPEEFRRLVRDAEREREEREQKERGQDTQAEATRLGWLSCWYHGQSMPSMRGRKRRRSQPSNIPFLSCPTILICIRRYSLKSPRMRSASCRALFLMRFLTEPKKGSIGFKSGEYSA
jgi:hypothetical protein